eukprot:INCI19786.1.p1 GENE.INCI19786.1~~INCI19786.1.p1  ORF type:complete len:189 (+),score=23.54 INCI19786.1:169-735(+)
MASTRGDLTNAEDAAEEKAKLLERLEALKREEVSKGDRTPEGRVPRQRIGSRTTKCAGTGSAEGGGQNRQQSPLATPKAISEASTTGASMSKTRKEKISAVLENRIRDSLRSLCMDPRLQWRKIQESCRTRKMGQAYVSVEELCETIAHLTAAQSKNAVALEDLTMVFQGQVPDPVYWEDYVEWYCRR